MLGNNTIPLQLLSVANYILTLFDAVHLSDTNLAHLVPELPSVAQSSQGLRDYSSQGSWPSQQFRVQALLSLVPNGSKQISWYVHHCQHFNVRVGYHVVNVISVKALS